MLPGLAASSLQGEVAFVAVVSPCHAQKPEPRRVAISVGDPIPIDHHVVAGCLPDRLPPMADQLPVVVACKFGHRQVGLGDSAAVELRASAPAASAAHAYARRRGEIGQRVDPHATSGRASRPCRTGGSCRVVK
jgi:hypothetical protein